MTTRDKALLKRIRGVLAAEKRQALKVGIRYRALERYRDVGAPRTVYSLFERDKDGRRLVAIDDFLSVRQVAARVLPSRARQ
jgi:hypothetical protein